MPETILTVKEFAELPEVDLTVQMVNRHIKSGRIKRTSWIDEKKGGKKIRVKEALNDLEQDGNPNQRRAGNQPGGLGSGAERSEAAGGEDRRIEDLVEVFGRIGDREVLEEIAKDWTLAEANKVWTVMRAAVEKLKIDEKSGALYSKPKIDRAMFTLGKLVGDRLSGIAAKLGPVLADISDIKECVERINQEVDRIREAVASELRKFDTPE